MIGRKLSWPNFKAKSRHSSWRDWGKSWKISIRIAGRRGRESNPGPREYEGVITARSRRFGTGFVFRCLLSVARQASCLPRAVLSRHKKQVHQRTPCLAIKVSSQKPFIILHETDYGQFMIMNGKPWTMQIFCALNRSQGCLQVHKLHTKTNTSL
jgi:hypothetical protein